MRAKDHHHRAVAGEDRTVGWTHCVAAGGCSGAAHGGVTFVSVCSCGARRLTESNGKHTRCSGWIEPTAEEREC